MLKIKRIPEVFLFSVILFSLIWAKGWAQFSNADCLNCHGDKTLSRMVKGKTISLYLDEPLFKKSIHGELECTNCHQSIKELPHAEKLASPDCGNCHSGMKETVSKGLHNLIKDGCWSCHGKHDIKSSEDPNSITHKEKKAELCLKCHKDREDVFFTTYQHSSVEFPGGAKGKVHCYQCHD